MDVIHPEVVSVKASDIHLEISLPKMKRRCSTFQDLPSVFNPEKPKDGIIAMEKTYAPQLHVRDQVCRRECRKVRAVACEILRAHYDAYRAGWESPDLHVRARFQKISSHYAVIKSRVRQEVNDPLMRKLAYLARYRV